MIGAGVRSCSIRFRSPNRLTMCDFHPIAKRSRCTTAHRAESRCRDVASGNFRAKNVAATFTNALFAFNPALPVFAGLNAKKTLTLFSTETGEAIRSLDFALGKNVKCLCFSPDGLTCAVAGSNKQFAVFDVDL